MFGTGASHDITHNISKNWTQRIYIFWDIADVGFSHFYFSCKNYQELAQARITVVGFFTMNPTKLGLHHEAGDGPLDITRRATCECGRSTGCAGTSKEPRCVWPGERAASGCGPWARTLRGRRWRGRTRGSAGVAGSTFLCRTGNVWLIFSQKFWIEVHKVVNRKVVDLTCHTVKFSISGCE
jgi:hypothetical protein